MIYEGVEFVIRAGLGRHEWILLISYPDNVDRSPTVSQFSGSMGDATASARRRIDGWMRRHALSADCGGSSSATNGEAVCCDGEGMPVFDRLRYRRDDRHVFLYAFDLR